MRNKLIQYFYILLLFIVAGMLTGCSDMVQIEDRDFVMGLALSYDNNEFTAILQRPDLQSITGQGVTDEQELLVSFTGENLSRIKEAYAKQSEKRLDFSHLKVIILDHKISESKKGMNEFLRYVEDEYEISRNTLVFYTADDEGIINGKIGDELQSLYQNNPSNADIKKVTVGDMINCLYQPDKVIILPLIKITKEGISLEGAGIFQKNLYGARMSEDDLTQWNMLQGKGTKRYISLPEGQVLKVRQLKTKYQYSMTDGTPFIQIYMEGEAELVEEMEDTRKDLKNSLNSFLKSNMERQINDMIKVNQLDYLNFYRNMSYRNRKMWTTYKGKQEEFLNEVTVLLDMDIKVEQH